MAIGRLKLLEPVDRVENFDADGGGLITRTLYCEPYTAHSRVATALKGTITPAGGGVWSRVVPHADPLYPWFYCSDVQVVPAFKRAVRACPPFAFVDGGAAGDDAQTGQLASIRTAMDNFDDFDGAAAIDNLLPSEIVTGAPSYTITHKSIVTNVGVNTDVSFYKSRGVCGAYVIATYRPLLFMPGVSEPSGGTAGGAGGPWDYVDPQWEPLTFKTQVGRQLQFWSPQRGIPGNPFVLHGGLLDTYERPEVVWRLSIKRLMVPFIPAITTNLFSNKINDMGPGAATQTIGNVTVQLGTFRMETPEVYTRRGPDGNIWHDIQYHFLIRQLWDEMFNAVGETNGPGWVTWNHEFGIPTAGVFEAGLGFIPGLMNQRASYYPVAWNGGFGQLFGTNHPVFATDAANFIDMTQIAGGGALPRAITKTPFLTGFQTGQ